VRYSQDPAQLASAIASNTVLTQSDDTVTMTAAYGAVLGMLVQDTVWTPSCRASS
jgi:hypothetical protein